MADALSGMGMTCTVALTNDIDGLVLAPPVNGTGGVLVAGTGSGATIVDTEGQVVRVGGWEYLASDEGSAFWLGRAGLAAAVRAVDGRGPATSLTARIESRLDRPIGDAVRRLAEQPHPRQAVADVAHCVTDAWSQDADEVAAELIDSAIEELASLVSAGLRRAVGAPPTWALTGGLVTQCDRFAQRLRARVQLFDPAAVVHVVVEPVSCLLKSPPTPMAPPGLTRRTVKVEQ
jgi:N-acetylglucosamine kinase-like BadF-type ATPase